MATKKQTYKQSAASKNFYNAIKAHAAVKFNTDKNNVSVVGNSEKYPNSVAMPTDIFMYDVVGFARYDANGKTVCQYAMKAATAMQCLADASANNDTITTKGVVGIDQVVRIPWNYIEPYYLELGAQ